MILLICDIEDTASAIKDDLGKEGFPVEHVHNFDQALSHGERLYSYQFVILDFESPGKDIVEIAQKIKQHPRLKFLPLLGILDKNRVIDQLLAFEAGVDDFIFVPYTTLDIQLKLRSIQRVTDLQRQLRKKDAQLENLKNIQRMMVTLNHYINNALTPLYFAIQIMDEHPGAEEEQKIKEIARESVEFISKVLQSLHRIVQSGKLKILREGVYKDIMFDIEKELNKLIEKTR